MKKNSCRGEGEGKELEPTAHTFTFRDAEGFVHAQTFKLVAGWSISHRVEFAEATRSERSAFARVEKARTGRDPILQRAASTTYLKNFPKGSKREETEALQRKAADLIEKVEALLAAGTDDGLKLEDRIEKAAEARKLVPVGTLGGRSDRMVLDLTDEPAF